MPTSLSARLLFDASKRCRKFLLVVIVVAVAAVLSLLMMFSDIVFIACANIITESGNSRGVSLSQLLACMMMRRVLIHIVDTLVPELQCGDASATAASWWRGIAITRFCRFSEVALHRARLVLGWVTVYEHVNHLGMKPAS